MVRIRPILAALVLTCAAVGVVAVPAHAAAPADIKPGKEAQYATVVAGLEKTLKDEQKFFNDMVKAFNGWARIISGVKNAPDFNGKAQELAALRGLVTRDLKKLDNWRVSHLAYFQSRLTPARKTLLSLVDAENVATVNAGMGKVTSSMTLMLKKAELDLEFAGGSLQAFNFADYYSEVAQAKAAAARAMATFAAGKKILLSVPESPLAPLG